MSKRPEPVLLPPSRAFIAFSLACAFLLNLLPWGPLPLVPDFVALVLVFWNLRQPQLVGIGVAFGLGLLMDIHSAALLGEHALAYSLVSYGAISLHRRLPWFGMFGRMMHLLPLFLIAQLSTLIVRLALGAEFPGWVYFAPSFVSVLVWAPTEWLLLAPQRRPVERDETRPL
ncbi:MAG: rod shape-determining protein MreD [Betaproteobacteria bacterium]|jgi:rod shape-determining protein MreD